MADSSSPKRVYEYLSRSPEYVRSVIILFKNSVKLGAPELDVGCTDLSDEECVRIMADILSLLELDGINVQIYENDERNRITIRRLVDMSTKK